MTDRGRLLSGGCNGGPLRSNATGDGLSEGAKTLLARGRLSESVLFRFGERASLEEVLVGSYDSVGFIAGGVRDEEQKIYGGFTKAEKHMVFPTVDGYVEWWGGRDATRIHFSEPRDGMKWGNLLKLMP